LHLKRERKSSFWRLRFHCPKEGDAPSKMTFFLIDQIHQAVKMTIFKKMGEPKAALAACGLSKIGRELSQVRGPNKAPAPSTESAFKEQVISYKKKKNR
jgi:hypothetical protein